MGYVSSLNGIPDYIYDIYSYIYTHIHNTLSLISLRQPGKAETRESSLENVENGTPSGQILHVKENLALDVLTVKLKPLLKQWHTSIDPK